MTQGITTTAVTVNPAFLLEIKEDSSLLRQMFAEVRAMISHPLGRNHQGAAFARLLDDLRDQFAMHFALEEAYGYFDEPMAQAPRLMERAERLRGEHEALYLDISDLAEEAAQLAYGKSDAPIPRGLARRFEEFDLRFQRHEADENEMIVEALDLDIGVGD